MGSLLISVHQKKELDLDNIVCLQAQINYTKIFLIDDVPIIVAKTLKSFEKEFLGHKFQRFYRSNKTFIINLNQVQNIKEIDNVLQIRLTNSIEVPVSRRKKKAFIASFEESTPQNTLKAILEK